jgi:hypothetical protein
MTKNLQTIEQSLSTLWTREEALSQFLSGSCPDGFDEEFSREIDARGVRLYASLIRHGRQDLMKSIYPGCQKILSRQWIRLVDRYFETRPPAHFNLNKAASGFSDFLKVDCPDLVARHGFLPELADYEWIELEIMESDERESRGETIALDSPEVFNSWGPVLNPVLAIRHYQYPITKLVDWLRDDVRLPRRIKKDAINLAIYRDPDEFYARFLELGDAAIKVVERVLNGPASYSELITMVVTENQGVDPQEVVMQTLELFEQLQERCLFLGSQQVV